MKPHSLVVLGTGGHAAVVIDLARTSGIHVAGCIGPGTPSFSSEFCRYLGPDEVLQGLDREGTELAVGKGSIGDCETRSRLFENGKALGFSFMRLTHPRAVIAQTVVLGEGAQVMAGAIVQPFAVIGKNVIVNTGAIIEHNVIVGDHAHVSPGAVVCGAASIGIGAHIGANATILQRVSIGARSIVGAGAVVVRHVECCRTVKGVPAV